MNLEFLPESDFPNILVESRFFVVFWCFRFICEIRGVLQFSGSSSGVFSKIMRNNAAEFFRVVNGTWFRFDLFYEKTS